MFRKLNQKGFTLIELLVVIAIIGILSTMAVVALTSANTKARDAKRQSDLKVLQTAIEMYSTDIGYAPVYSTWDVLQTALATYMPGGLPQDPGSGANARIWCYCVDAGGSGKYLIATSLERSQNIAGDLDTDNTDAANIGVYAFATECICSDAAAPAMLDCQDSATGTIDTNTTVSAVCLGAT